MILFIMLPSILLSLFRGKMLVKSFLPKVKVQRNIMKLFASSSVNSNDIKVSTAMPNVTETYHIPVMLEECCNYLDIKPNGIYVDCTLGGGGHTSAILERGGRVIGIDQDPDAIKFASNRLSKYLATNQLEIIQTNFRNINSAIKNTNLWKEIERNNKNSNNNNDNIGVDGVLMDLGISSHQIDYYARGFAFGQDGPLDMRMNQGIVMNQVVNKEMATIGDDTDDSVNLSVNSDESSFTAATIVNKWDLNDIANTLFEYGDVTKSRQIAREIVMNRPINSTGHLAGVISRVTAWQQRPQTLARCFQALRITVNDEITVLESTLDNIHNVIRPSGRLVILSYHSLEDRRVKNLFKFGNCDGKNMFPEQKSSLSSAMVIPKIENEIWDLVLKKAQAPTEEEVERNKRSRSAKLRVAERIGINKVISSSDSIRTSKTSGVASATATTTTTATATTTATTTATATATISTTATTTATTVDSGRSSSSTILIASGGRGRGSDKKKGKAMMGAKQLAKEAKRLALEAEESNDDEEE